MDFTAVRLNFPTLPEKITNQILAEAVGTRNDLYNPCCEGTPVPTTLTYIEDMPADVEEKIHNEYMDRELSTPDGKVKSLHLPRYPLTGESKEWIGNNIINEYIACSVGVTTVSDSSKTLGPHVGLTRAYILMYLLDKGGENVQTRFYQKHGEPKVYGLCRTVPTDYAELDLIDSQKFELGNWYIVNESILHDIHGIETPRISVQISLGKDLPEVIKSQITV